MIHKTIFILYGLLFLSACAPIPHEFEQLDRTLFAYERALRWQNYDTVIAFHRNEQGRISTDKRKLLKRYRVTAYEEAYRRLENKGKSLTQVVEIKYYNDEYAVIKSLTLNNQWEYDQQQQRWYLTNPIPDFK